MCNPTTLDELLAIVPGLRRLRSLGADMLRYLLDRKRGECTWCGAIVPKGRRTWCSDACVSAFRSRCDANYQRAMVEKRDGGICAECGRDTIESAAMWRRAIPRPDRKEYGFARGSWREVDHIVPVVEGGGLCGLDNLRLLCGVCHARATKLLAGRRMGG